MNSYATNCRSYSPTMIDSGMLSLNGEPYRRPRAKLRALHGDITQYLYYSKNAVTRHSKPPGDIFPLIDSTKQIPANTLIGSAKETRKVGTQTWYRFDTSPGWFQVDGTNFVVKTVTGPELTDAQKQQVITSAIKAADPTGTVVVAEAVADAAEAVADGAKKAFNIAKWIVPAIVGTGLLVAGVYVYKNTIKEN